MVDDARLKSNCCYVLTYLFVHVFSNPFCDHHHNVSDNTHEQSISPIVCCIRSAFLLSFSNMSVYHIWKQIPYLTILKCLVVFSCGKRGIVHLILFIMAALVEEEKNEM